MITVDVDSGNPPFMNGSLSSAKGLYPALIETVFGMMGVQAQIMAKPWKRCILDLDQGQAGVGGIYKTGQRLARYDYSAPLYGAMNIEEAAIPLAVNPTYLAFNKSAHAAETLRECNLMLAILKRSPLYDQIITQALSSRMRDLAPSHNRILTIKDLEALPE